MRLENKGISGKEIRDTYNLTKGDEVEGYVYIDMLNYKGLSVSITNTSTSSGSIDIEQTNNKASYIPLDSIPLTSKGVSDKIDLTTSCRWIALKCSAATWVDDGIVVITSICKIH